MFIYRAWEDKLVRDSQLNHDSTYVAIANYFRKKNKSPIKLWTPRNEVDVEQMRELVHELKQEDISSTLSKLRKING